MTAPLASFGDRLFAVLFWMLPTRAISRLAQILADTRLGPIKRALIAGFMRAYPAIDMREAKRDDPYAYPSFNAFFTRSLGDNARPLPADPEQIISPVDGILGAFGTARAGRICQTKGIAYDLRTLVGGSDALTTAFLGGSYTTFYLAPHNYHRVHMPINGCLRETHYVPGRLFGVNPRCVRALPRLFTRNERLVSCFDTAVGPVVLVMVGAFIVGGIHTRWAGQICPPHRRRGKVCSFIGTPIKQSYFARGAEIGYFAMGSSVILLFGPGALVCNPGLTAGQTLRLGDPIGRLGLGPKTLA
jgi:phosphatidylserine decarboxylase